MTATVSAVVAPDVADVRRLSAEDSHRLWLDVLARQGLAGADKPETAEDVADRCLGLHAARLPSPLATLLARLRDPDAAEVLFDDHRPRAALRTVRCMRKTLHVLPSQWADTAHAATRYFRERDARRLAHNAGLSSAELSRLVIEVTDLVAVRGQLGHRELETLIPRARCSLPALRAALKFAWETGRLTYRNVSPHWNREVRRFAPATCQEPDVDLDTAGHALIVAYFDRYGPATLADAAWWSGLSRRLVATALHHCGRPLQRLATPWSEAVLYQFDDQVADVERRADDRAVVDFLAHEDVALKAYFTTRRRYLDTVAPGYAFNAIGEVLPTILHNGRVIGRWSWDRRHRSVTAEPAVSDRRIIQACNKRADELTVILRRRHDST